MKLTFEMKGIIAKYLSLLKIRFEASSSISSPSSYCLCKKKKKNPYLAPWKVGDVR